MRTLLLSTLVLFMATPAFAARLQSVNSLQSPDLAIVEEIFYRSAEAAEDQSEEEGGDRGVSQGLKMKIVSKKPSEKYANSIKQAIYITNAGPYTTPTEVIVQEITPQDVDKAVEQMIFYLGGFSESSPVEDLRSVLSDVLPKANIKAFTASFGNDHGGASDLVLIDTQTNEILAVGSALSADE